MGPGGGGKNETFSSIYCYLLHIIYTDYLLQSYKTKPLNLTIGIYFKLFLLVFIRLIEIHTSHYTLIYIYIIYILYTIYYVSDIYILII